MRSYDLFTQRNIVARRKRYCWNVGEFFITRYFVVLRSAGSTYNKWQSTHKVCLSEDSSRKRTGLVICRSRFSTVADNFATSKRTSAENLWHEFFSDPSQWWDHRLEKGSSSFPDFKHKKTQKSLWLDSKWKPLWVEAKLAVIAPGTLQSNVFSWNQRLSKYTRAGHYEKTFDVFHQMQSEGINPDKFTFVPVLNACVGLNSLERGKCVHKLIRQCGFASDMYVGNCLVHMYMNCGSIVDAWYVFNNMPRRDVVTWNSIILGYVHNGQELKALELYQQMKREDVEATSVTFLGLLRACSCLEALDEGRYVHGQIIQSGCESVDFVGSALVDMYAKCGSIADAWEVFEKMPTRDVVAWSAMILGYVKCGQGFRALKLYPQMRQEGVDADSVTFLGLLNACASEEALEEGRGVHMQIIKSGFDSDPYVANTLVHMYASCGSIEDACKVFSEMSTPDVIGWNSMISGYVKCGQGLKALKLYRQMQLEGFDANAVTYLAVLNACANAGALEQGRDVHSKIILNEFESDSYIGNALVDMYAKCGSIEDAIKVFNKMSRCDVVGCNAMLGGYASNGLGKEALEHFEWMNQENIRTDGVTFVCLLCACSHGGLVEEGLHYFESMSSIYGISPSMDHYACMVDLLGRSGRLLEAEELMRLMPWEPDATLWMSVLGACRIHGNVEVGEHAATQVLELDPGMASCYVVLSNIYAAAGNWEAFAAIKQERLEKNVGKLLGDTWIEVNGEMHSITVADQEHPQILEFHAELERLSLLMTEVGYFSDAGFVLHDVDDQQKVSPLCHHSENLAIAYGLISTPPCTPLRIFKNLGICGDCHTAAKFISKVVGREIILRDASRFHHFKGGLCSCKDYW